MKKNLLYFIITLLFLSTLIGCESKKSNEEYEAGVYHDQTLMNTISTELGSEYFLLKAEEPSNFIEPSTGDYSLEEYLDNCGLSYKTRFYNFFNISSSEELESQIKSMDESKKKIRVAYYGCTNGLEICVYIPDSNDPSTNYLIYGGVKKK